MEGKSLNQVCGTPDYVAPEIIKHQNYDHKCDIWSAGVIVYILLGGYAPFQARNPDDRDELFKVIKKGKLVFHERYWKTISGEAKDLITQMLTMDPDARPDADQLLSHQWIGRPKGALSKNNLEESKRRLKDFNAKRKLKGAAKAVQANVRLNNTISAFNMGSAASSKISTVTE